jgi:DNA polymerase elongation subunit (family B)
MRRIFFDIETSPNIVYSWRTGHRLFISPESIIKERKIICICWKWEHKKYVYSLKWDDNQDDKIMLQKFIEQIELADEIIGHNGDNFDIKWLRTRAIYHNIPMPVEIQSLDTLKKARKGFKFNSNKLDYIGKFLKVGEKQDTNFDLWKNVLNGDKQALKKMIDYCKNDVVLLQKVYEKLEQYIQVNIHAGVNAGLDRWSCPTCATSHVRFNGQRVTKSGYVKYRMRCYECGKGYSVSGVVYRRFLEHQYILKNKKK